MYYKDTAKNSFFKTKTYINMIYAQETAPMLGIFNSMAFVLGCCIGSFMNVVVWRLPRGESLSHPPSHCPKCGHAIRPWENIPIISWLCLSARCSPCHLPISIKYPIGEAAPGLLFAAIWGSIYLRNLPLDIIPAYFFLGGALLAVALIDAEHWFIPNEVTYSGIVFALAMAVILPDGRLHAQQSSIIFKGLCHIIENCGFQISTYPIAGAVLDAALGAAMGFALLTAFAAFRPLFGRKVRLFSKQETLLISKQGIAIGGKETPWEELLDRPDEHCILHGNLIENGKNKGVSSLKANADGYEIDGAKGNWDAHKPLKFKASRMATPSDVIGRGDVKLLAMCGAFLGADATIYILLAASIIAVAYSLILSCIRRRLITHIPFGPFIAVASLAWMLLGNFYFVCGTNLR